MPSLGPRRTISIAVPGRPPPWGGPDRGQGAGDRHRDVQFPGTARACLARARPRVAVEHVDEEHVEVAPAGVARRVGERRHELAAGWQLQVADRGVAVAESPVLVPEHGRPRAGRRLAPLDLEDRRLQRRRGLGVGRPDREAERRRREPGHPEPERRPRRDSAGTGSTGRGCAVWRFSADAAQRRAQASGVSASRIGGSTAETSTGSWSVSTPARREGSPCRAAAAGRSGCRRTAAGGAGRHRRGHGNGELAAPAAKTRS